MIRGSAVLRTHFVRQAFGVNVVVLSTGKIASYGSLSDEAISSVVDSHFGSNKFGETLFSILSIVWLSEVAPSKFFFFIIAAVAAAAVAVDCVLANVLSVRLSFCHYGCSLVISK